MMALQIIVALLVSACSMAAGLWIGLAVARACIRDHERRKCPLDAPIPGEGWIQ